MLALQVRKLPVQGLLSGEDSDGVLQDGPCRLHTASVQTILSITAQQSAAAPLSAVYAFMYLNHGQPYAKSSFLGMCKSRAAGCSCCCLDGPSIPGVLTT